MSTEKHRVMEGYGLTETSSIINISGYELSATRRLESTIGIV